MTQRIEPHVFAGRSREGNMSPTTPVPTPKMISVELHHTTANGQYGVSRNDC